MTIGYIIAMQRKLPVRKIEVHIEGDLNTDIFLGKSNEFRAWFSDIRIQAKIDADMSQEEKQKFLMDVDARCPISDNIRGLTPIKFMVE